MSSCLTAIEHNAVRLLHRICAEHEEISPFRHVPKGYGPQITSSSQKEMLSGALRLAGCDGNLNILRLLHITYPNYDALTELLIERLIDARLEHEALEMAERLQGNSPYQITLERAIITARHRLFGEPSIEDYKAALRDKYCYAPFEQLFIGLNSTHLCCMAYLPISVGNPGKMSFDEVANSEWAVRIRQSILDGDFTYCSLLRCPQIQSTLSSYRSDKGRISLLKSKDDVIRTGNIHAEYILGQKVTIESGFVPTLSYDETCNLACPSCRDHTRVASKREAERLHKITNEFVIPNIWRFRSIKFGAAGDPFASSSERAILKEINSERYPSLKLFVQTNGILFKKYWEQMTNLHDMIHTLAISIDAASAPTYETIRRGGRWEKLLQSLELIRSLREAEVIKQVFLHFVVQKGNYREMRDFVALGQKYKADMIEFMRFINFGNLSEEQYREMDVSGQWHPEHPALLEILRDDIFNQPIVWMSSMNTLREKALKNQA